MFFSMSIKRNMRLDLYLLVVELIRAIRGDDERRYKTDINNEPTLHAEVTLIKTCRRHGLPLMPVTRKRSCRPLKRHMSLCSR